MRSRASPRLWRTDLLAPRGDKVLLRAWRFSSHGARASSGTSACTSLASGSLPAGVFGLWPAGSRRS
eukprot:1301962-Pyramimonas_sp.AAC.1